MNNGIKTILVALFSLFTIMSLAVTVNSLRGRDSLKRLQAEKLIMAIDSSTVCDQVRSESCLIIQQINGTVSDGSLRLGRELLSVQTAESIYLGRAGDRLLTAQVNRPDASAEADPYISSISELISASETTELCVEGRSVSGFLLKRPLSVSEEISLGQGDSLLQLLSCSESSELKQGLLGSGNLDLLLVRQIETSLNP
jgi:hypothetical protein